MSHLDRANTMATKKKPRSVKRVARKNAPKDFSANGKPVDILLVEDNPEDVELTLEALRDSRVENRPNVARDGVEAMDFLYRRGAYKDAATPDIIFLDLNMPRKSGREVLEEIKADKDLKRIPVIILTTSKAEEDILRSYQLQAAAYVAKPVDFGQFVNAIRALENFWFRVVKFPSKT